MEAKINAYLHERIGYRDLLRALITHKKWTLPAQNEDNEFQPTLLQDEDKVLLTAYSQPELAPQDLDTVIVDGIWLFSEIPNIDALIIDPHAQHSLKFKKEQFSDLKRWAKAVRIEELLSQTELDANVLEELLSYEGYCVPLILSKSGKQHIALAPDPDGRKLAAIFTAEDCLSIFVQHAGNALGDKIIIDQPNGASLLPYLVSLPIDGIVFNSHGPPSPRALRRESLEQLLSERNTHD
jgi:hypothetical protein